MVSVLFNAKDVEEKGILKRILRVRLQIANIVAGREKLHAQIAMVQDTLNK